MTTINHNNETKTIEITCTSEVAESITKFDWTWINSDNVTDTQKQAAVEMAELLGEDVYDTLIDYHMAADGWQLAINAKTTADVAEEAKMKGTIQIKGTTITRDQFVEFLNNVEVSGGLNDTVRSAIVTEVFDGINPKLTNVKGIGNSKSKDIKVALSRYIADLTPKKEKTVKTNLNNVARLAKKFNLADNQVNWLHEAESKGIVESMYDRESKTFWFRFNRTWYFGHKPAARRIIDAMKAGAKAAGVAHTWSRMGNGFRF